MDTPNTQAVGASATATSSAADSSADHAQQPSMLMGAEILVKCLEAEGVQQIWGYPGGAALYIYDALYKQEAVRHVLVRHEQAAGYPYLRY